MADLTPLIADAEQDFAHCHDVPALENAKAKYLGKSGALTEALKGLGKLSAEERPAAVTKKPKASHEAEGPIIDAAERDDVVSGQDDVDDLLSSLGF